VKTDEATSEEKKELPFTYLKSNLKKVLDKLSSYGFVLAHYLEILENLDTTLAPAETQDHRH
jgi:hypothetical protein